MCIMVINHLGKPKFQRIKELAGVLFEELSRTRQAVSGLETNFSREMLCKLLPNSEIHMTRPLACSLYYRGAHEKTLRWLSLFFKRGATFPSMASLTDSLATSRANFTDEDLADFEAQEVEKASEKASEDNSNEQEMTDAVMVSA